MDSAPQNRGPFIEEMTSFLNTFKAIPSPMMIMGYGGQMRSVSCEALWKLANKIPIDINECSAMFHTDWTPMPAARSNVQDRYFSSATPIASTHATDATHTTTRAHAAARARRRIVMSDAEDCLQEEVVPFLRRLKMLMTMKCHLMNLCVAKGWGQMGTCWRLWDLRHAQRVRAIVPCGLPPINASKHCWDSVRPLLHLALAGAKLWATTNH